ACSRPMVPCTAMLLAARASLSTWNTAMVSSAAGVSIDTVQARQPRKLPRGSGRRLWITGCWRERCGLAEVEGLVLVRLRMVGDPDRHGGTTARCFRQPNRAIVLGHQ